MKPYEINTNKFGKVHVGGLPTKFGWGSIQLTDWASDKQVDSWRYRRVDDVEVRNEQEQLRCELIDDVRYNIQGYPTPDVKKLLQNYTHDLVHAKERLTWVTPEYPDYVTLVHNVSLNQEFVDIYTEELERRKGIVKSKKALRKLVNSHPSLEVGFLHNDMMDCDTWRVGTWATMLVPNWGIEATSCIQISDSRFICQKDYNYEKDYCERNNESFDYVLEEKDPFYGRESCDTWQEAVERAEEYIRFFEEEVV